ncbi:MAG: alginate lyase family protein [Planctomycetota bacterium]
MPTTSLLHPRSRAAALLLGSLFAACSNSGGQTPQQVPTPPAEPRLGIWISAEELAALPMTGAAWEHLREVADTTPPRPDLSDQDQMTNVTVMAKALVYARTGDASYRDEVVAACMAATETPLGRTLALGRELAAYVIAADLVHLDGAEDAAFRIWLREMLTVNLRGRTLRSTQERRPNNWGTHAGASRAAVALYLEDRAELERSIQVFRGWLGDRQAYNEFRYGELSWQADPHTPVGINPAGATKRGHSIDGVMPDDMRRGSPFRWPPRETGYPWEALQGGLMHAEILHRAGFTDVWDWQDRALLRAVQFLYGIGWAAHGDDEWQVWLINHRYGTDYPTVERARAGKNVGWTAWTHGPGRDRS